MFNIHVFARIHPRIEQVRNTRHLVARHQVLVVCTEALGGNAKHGHLGSVAFHRQAADNVHATLGEENAYLQVVAATTVVWCGDFGHGRFYGMLSRFARRNKAEEQAHCLDTIEVS